MAYKPHTIRMDTESKTAFKMAAAKARLSEGELASRLLGDWADRFLKDQAELPPERPQPQGKKEGRQP